MKSIRHRLICHNSFVLSLLLSCYILIVCGWPHSIFGWPCVSLSLVSNCVPVRKIIVRCLSPDWRLSFLYIGVILAYRSLLLFYFVLFCLFFFVFLFFFLQKCDFRVLDVTHNHIFLENIWSSTKKKYCVVRHLRTTKLFPQQTLCFAIITQRNIF